MFELTVTQINTLYNRVELKSISTLSTYDDHKEQAPQQQNTASASTLVNQKQDSEATVDLPGKYWNKATRLTRNRLTHNVFSLL